MGRGQWWGEEKRRELLAAHRRCGVSLKAFTARVGVPYSTMLYWRQRGEPADPPRFVPVEVEGEGAPLEVIVGGVVVRVGADFDEPHLARVLRSLRACWGCRRRSGFAWRPAVARSPGARRGTQ